ncbi:MAG TPA: RNA methyltransferase [Chloroflexota bacterium]|nr:RNA methyltransferase [Chloroflexota bacterium]
MSRPDVEREPITGLENSQVKLVRSLHDAAGRRRHSAFLVEGLRLVESAVASGTPILALHAPEFGRVDGRERALVRRLQEAGAALRPVSARVLQHVTDTVNPQGIVAVMPLPSSGKQDGSEGAVASRGWASTPEDDKSAPLALILDEVNDPGNAGTLLRSAAAAGVRCLLASRGTVDLFSPKVVRAGAGAHFALSISTGLSWGDLGQEVRRQAIEHVLLADVGGESPYWEADWTASTALIVSNEARGATAAARALASATVSIPMRHMESLNVGVAGSVILFEALRQRTTQCRGVPAD